MIIIDIWYSTLSTYNIYWIMIYSLSKLIVVIVWFLIYLCHIFQLGIYHYRPCYKMLPTCVPCCITCSLPAQTLSSTFWTNPWISHRYEWTFLKKNFVDRNFEFWIVPTLCAISRLNCDPPIVSGGRNWKPKPNPKSLATFSQLGWDWNPVVVRDNA